MRSRVGIVVPLAVVSGWISAAGMALGAQEGSLFFEGFDGRWTVTAVVHGPAGETVERTLKATIRRSHMAPAQLVEIVLTGPLPAAFEMTCPDGHSVPLPCDTRFSLACYCEREEQLVSGALPARGDNAEDEATSLAGYRIRRASASS